MQEGYYDPKANDVWALGILFTKLSGLAHPFVNPDGKEDSEKVKDRIEKETPWFDWQPEDLDRGGKAELLLGMLDRDPSRRWTVCTLPVRTTQTDRHADTRHSQTCLPKAHVLRSETVSSTFFGPSSKRNPTPPAIRYSRSLFPFLPQQRFPPMRDVHTDRATPFVILPLLGEEMDRDAQRMEQAS